MKEYLLKDISPGLSHSFQVQLTGEMMDTFEKLTGDANLLHTSKDFAVANGYKDRVAYGMLTSSFYSTLVGMYLPGKYALLQGVDVSLIAPVFPGDTLTVFGEVVAVHEAFRQIEIKAYIMNQLGKKISRAKIRSGIHE
jgi:3-hydroxybutyryl-CoA dehydratase